MDVSPAARIRIPTMGKNLNFAPAPKPIDTQLMRSFYAEATAFYKAAPWKIFQNGDLFGVLIPETSELHFVSIMGNGGECFGLATYRGYEGLRLFFDVMNGAGLEDPDTCRRRQDGLLLEFVQKKFLSDFEKAHVKATGFNPVDKDSWVFVRELSPGWEPWWPKEQDIKSLCHILAVLPEVIRNQKENRLWTHDKSGKRLPVFVFKKQKAAWQFEWWGKRKIARQHSEDEGPLKIKALDELLIARVAKSGKKSKATWEALSFYSREPVLEGDRPFYPKICAVLDQKTELCFGLELASPDNLPGAVLRDLTLTTIQKTGEIPACIVTDDPKHLFGLLTLKEALGIDIKLEPLEVGPMLIEDFRENENSEI